MTYGDKRDYRKINIFQVFRLPNGTKQVDYICTTTWSRTCREAVQRYKEVNSTQAFDKLVAYFQKD